MDATRRRFTLADMMILVAALGVGFLLLRVYDESREKPPAFNLPSYVWGWGQWATPFLMTTPVALLLMRSRGPRPAARRLVRQPGTVACLALTAFVMAGVLLLYVRTLIRPWIGSLPLFLPAEYYFNFMLHSGSAVAIAWFVQVLLHAWRPEPGWIDRAGRAYGALMIAVWVLGCLGL